MVLGYDPKAICTIDERDIVAEPAFKRPKLHVFADNDTGNETRISEHDWQAAMKSYENGFNFTQACAFIGKISKKQHAGFGAYVERTCRKAQAAFKRKRYK